MGILYKGMVASGMLVAGVLTQALANAAPERVLPKRAASEAEAITACEAAAGDRMTGTVAEATVTRVWRGSEGFIVTLTLVNEAGGRRDFTCREGDHGLQVARS